MGPRLAKLIAACLLSLAAAMVPPGFARAAEAAAGQGKDPVAAAFDRLPEAQRRAVQAALIWTGEFAGVVSGTFGPRTRDGLAAYAKRIGLRPAGVLDDGPRERLLAEAQRVANEVGFASVTDKRSGAHLSLPLTLLPKLTATGNGSRYSGADGSLVVDTLSRPAGEGGLRDTFERMSVETATRKVTYKVLRPDSFVVSGETGNRTFYSRFAAGTVDGAAILRGFTFSYPKASATTMDRVALAVAASFEPLPTAAASPPPPPSAKTEQSATEAAASQNIAAPGQGLRRTWVNAVLVGPGLALTTASQTECPDAQSGGTKAAWRHTEPDTGLGLLEVSRPDGHAVALASAHAGPEPVFALFREVSDPAADGPQPLLVAPGDLRPGNDDVSGLSRISAPLQAGAVGAAVIDRTGGLAGLVADGAPPASTTVAGTVVQTSYPVKDHAAIAAFLSRANVNVNVTSLTPTLADLGTVVAAWRPAILLLDCGVAEKQGRAVR